MFSVRRRIGIAVLGLSTLVLSGCSSQDSAAETCQRMSQVQEQIAQFELAAEGSPEQRAATVEEFAGELADIGDSAGDAQLQTAAHTLADMYLTISQIATANPLHTPEEILWDMAATLDAEQILQADTTFTERCDYQGKQ